VIAGPPRGAAVELTYSDWSMPEWLEWLTDMRYTKPVALVLFFVVFVVIVLYVFTGKKRSKRLESYKDIPFLDDDDQETKVSEKDSKDG
jgi:cbb3-type cytochrome oxidase subunit 3